jgi:hypothetical protein
VTAVVVLGMHRSGTSCVAGMIAAGGVASAGRAVRNWDNARGHHEMLELLRLDEAVLAYSGGHWLAAPGEVRWSAAHAAERDRLLATRVAGSPALLKDPRMLLVLPFWRASPVPFHVVGVVRHPIAVARSLESWREMPLADGVALWTAHARALAADHAHHAYPVVDFDAPPGTVIAAVGAACRGWAADRTVDEPALARAYEDRLVHHDGHTAPDLPQLAEALALHRGLGGGASPPAPRAFPRAELAAFLQVSGEPALPAARAALARAPDVAAVLVPIVTALVRRHACVEARDLIVEHARWLDAGLADLLLGKVALAMGAAATALVHFEEACAVNAPFFQARALRPQAMRGAGKHAEARAALRELATATLYPHGPLSTLAEWSWEDGAPDAALAEMAEAIAAAPLHRRGRLRTRRAEWLVTVGDEASARAELAAAIAEDPGYARSRDVLARLTPA